MDRFKLNRFFNMEANTASNAHAISPEQVLHRVRAPQEKVETLCHVKTMPGPHDLAMSLLTNYLLPKVIGIIKDTPALEEVHEHQSAVTSKI